MVNHANFRTTQGDPIPPEAVTFRTTAAAGPAPAPDGQSQAAAQDLVDVLQRHYSHRTVHDPGWDTWEARAMETLGAQPDPLAFAHAAATLLSELQDPHVSVVVDEQWLSTHRPTDTVNFDLAAVRARLDLTQHSDAVWTGQLEGVGYLLVSSWVAGATTSAALDDALRTLERSGSMVVDVRPNGGGDEQLAQRLAGHFVSESKVYASHRSIDGRGGLGPLHHRTLTPLRPHVDAAVAVLQGPACMSSNEAFLLMMARAGARSFGETSAGSSGNPQPHPLGNGVTVLVPSWQALTPGGAPIEGQGVVPDVVIEWTGHGDPVLDAAVGWLNSPR